MPLAEKQHEVRRRPVDLCLLPVYLQRPVREIADFYKDGDVFLSVNLEFQAIQIGRPFQDLDPFAALGASSSLRSRGP